MNELLFLAGPVLAVILIGIFLPLIFRRVVPINQVHVVQSRKSTKSYGKGSDNGNVYYEWPASWPVIGVTTVVLPVSVFDLSLHEYEAYDIDRVPFVVDVVAFFRIEDTNTAAQRVESFHELNAQLKYIVQGAVRTILAKVHIDQIMLERATFGEEFTREVQNELKSWGVAPVKNMELMDIRDGVDSKVIDNIMQKKESFIERESRVEVAENMKQAEMKEIEARQDVQVRDQEALQVVGERTADKDKAVGIANEKAAQDIKQEQRETMDRQMSVVQVEQVRAAEIEKAKQIVAAEQDKDTTILIADGDLEAEKRRAEGVKVNGLAQAEADKAIQLAPVEAQIVLAQEIGDNDGYQNYLISIDQIKANEVVGIAQAKALEVADIKIIANTGEPVDGVKNVMDLFSSKGGTAIASMFEGLVQSEDGKKIVSRLTGDKAAGDAGKSE